MQTDITKIAEKTYLKLYACPSVLITKTGKIVRLKEATKRKAMLEIYMQKPQGYDITMQEFKDFSVDIINKFDHK